MSQDTANTKDLIDNALPERDGLDLPVPEHTPEDIEALYDAPEPKSLVEQRIRETGFVLLNTEEENLRSELLDAIEPERERLGEEGLLRWRLKSGQRRREHAERIAFERFERRKGIGAGLFIGLLFGGAAWAVVLFGDATPADPDITLTPEVLAAVAAPVEVPPTITEVDGGTLVEVQTELWTPPVVDGTYKTWEDDGHRFWQFDFESEGMMSLRWVDPSGAVRLDDTECTNRIDGDTGRCYVGRNLARFADAPEGDWTLVGCLDGRCGPVSNFSL